MFDFGFWEITLILIVSLIVIGPDKLPSFAAQIGTWVRKLKILANNFRNSIENESEVSELKKIISHLISKWIYFDYEHRFNSLNASAVIVLFY